MAAMESDIIRVRTGSREAVADITGQCAEFARSAAGAVTGCCTCSCRTPRRASRSSSSARAAIPTCSSALAALLPADDRWQHAHGSRGHGRSHVMPAFIPPYATVPVLGGRLALGTWQSIALVDVNVDNPDRQVRLSFLPG